MQTAYYIALANMVFCIIIGTVMFANRKYEHGTVMLLLFLGTLAMLTFMIRSDHKSEDRSLEFSNEMKELKNSYSKEK